MAEFILLGVGIWGILTFVADYRRKRLRWWDWPMLVIYVLLILQSICAWVCPDVLKNIYG